MKNLKQSLFGLIILLGVLITASCSDFLDFTPKGTISADQLQTPEKVEQLVIASYATLGNTGFSTPYASDWVWGSVRSDDAYKGGAGTADQQGINILEQYNLVVPDANAYFPGIWIALYNSISRVNNTIRELSNLTDAQMPFRTTRIAEMRFLRGHYHFLLKRIFKYPVYADHTVAPDSLVNVSNRVYTNDQLWDKIGEDFRFAVDNLPETQAQKGRANRFSAAAYLAKLRLYQAYQQDENHTVTSINQAKLQEVVTLADQVINSGRYGLFDNFGKNFTFGYENGIESIFAIQFSSGDGTTFGRLNMDHSLNYNQAAQYGCCSFHTPSQNVVNAFKTENGLPRFDTFNQTEMKNAADFQSNTVDPRLDHTVGIPSHPYKYDLTFITQSNWARTPGIYGNFVAMKENQLPVNTVKNGAFVGSAHNIDILRYDDLLLMKAEALIELGQFEAARPLINQVRQRAANSVQWLRYANNTTFSNYNVTTYDGVNLPWTQANARKALQWERRLEFAMESPRFFDLVRWGIASETLNGYLTVEKTRHTYLNNARFTKGRDEYLPIPTAQINLVNGLYVQNTGY